MAKARRRAFAAAVALLCVANGPANQDVPAPAHGGLPTAVDAGWHGARVCEVLIDNAAMRTARCTFPPGGGHERHWHPRHWGYVLSDATMRITTATGTVVRNLKAGDSWWSDCVAWHEAVNIGSTTGVYIIVEPKG